MITNQLKECCNNCVNADLDITSGVIFKSGADPFEVNVIILCKHQEVCKYYSDDSEEE